MKEIKFRAWSLITSKMFQDVQWGIEYCDSLRPFAYVIDRAEPEKNAKFVVMQYTGLKDKNGKEIFEGDIVKKLYGATNPTCIVAWHDERAMFIQQDGYNEPLYHLHPKHIEIIGNVYENESLIK